MEELESFGYNSPIWLKKIGLVVLFFICYMFVVILVTYGGDFLIAKALNMPVNLVRKMSTTDSKTMLYSYIINFTATVFVIYMFWRFVIKKEFPTIGFEDISWLKNLLFGMICGVIAISLGFIISVLFGFVKVEAITFSTPDFSNYLIIFALVAISEELMTRGLMLSTLMDGMNDYLALLLVSLIFGALHLFNDNVTTLSFINICIAGLFLGISYIHNRSLWFPIGLHFTWNFFQGPVYGYEVSGHKNVSIVQQTIHGNDTFTGGEFGFEGSIIAIPIMIVAILAIHIYYTKEENENEKLAINNGD
jgi:uncharacterized protein